MNEENQLGMGRGLERFRSMMQRKHSGRSPDEVDQLNDDLFGNLAGYVEDDYSIAVVKPNSDGSLDLRILNTYDDTMDNLE